MNKPRILVVDDEPDVVTMLERILVADSFEVIRAYDGISALDLAENEQPDLILLDIMMPMMSGYEVCQQLKANPHTKDIPVVTVSSGHSAAAFEHSMKVGAETLIVKPFTPAELVAQVKRYLRARAQNA